MAASYKGTLDALRKMNRQDLPVARNPWPYMVYHKDVPIVLKPPPSNFSDQGVARAEKSIKRPSSAVRQRNRTHWHTRAAAPRPR